MLIVEKYKYLPLNRIDHPSGRKYEDPTGNLLPSVTTVLSATSDRSFLVEWQERIGKEEADRISLEATTIGTHMHSNLEHYILEGKDPSEGPLISKLLANLIIKKGLKDIDEVWGSEVMLYYPGLWAGTTDLVGVHKGSPAIIDFKNSIKSKKKDWIHDYFKQGCAYLLAHNELYGTDIKKIVIMIGVREGKYQEFIIEGEEVEEYCKQWLDSVEDYYEKIGK